MSMDLSVYVGQGEFVFEFYSYFALILSNKYIHHYLNRIKFLDKTLCFWSGVVMSVILFVHHRVTNRIQMQQFSSLPIQWLTILQLKFSLFTVYHFCIRPKIANGRCYISKIEKCYQFILSVPQQCNRSFSALLTRLSTYLNYYNSDNHF